MSELLDVKIKLFDGAELPKIVDVGDWIDLATPKEITLKEGEMALIPLGVAMELPKEYEAIVVPRSSAHQRWGLWQTNSISVIDEAYKGDNDQWFLPVQASWDVTIPRGTRICQFRIIKHQPRIRFVPVEKLDNANRGGHGSTGTSTDDLDKYFKDA